MTRGKNSGNQRNCLTLEKLEERRVLASLIPRSPSIKPDTTVVDEVRHEMERFVVKFTDGSPIRLRNGELVDQSSQLNAGVNKSSLLEDDVVEAALALVHNGSWTRMDSVPEEVLEEQRQRAQANTGKAISDLNTYFYVNVPDAENLSFIIDTFNKLDIVELAQPIPRSVLPPSNSEPNAPPPPIPGSFEANQGYLTAAPAGVDAYGVWAQYGVRGESVQVIDIEYTFDALHQDLPNVTIVGPTPDEPGFGPDHGTAVLGQMAGLDNGWGVTGISPDSKYFFAGAFTQRQYLLAEAISVATAAMSPGDIILLEQQTAGPNFGQGGQFGMVPVEWFEPYYARIVTAVGNGIIVVEAAGNGSQNLDDPIYSTGNGGHHPFLAGRGSGAIIVGAGAAATGFGGTQAARSRLDFSNYGSRLDLQGWGRNVWTTGYGDAYSQEGPHLSFTSSFSGTSSASPIVTGAAALVQSAYKDFTGTVLTPAQMRQILIDTGTPQQDGPFPATQKIGPLPNALAAIDKIFGDLPIQLTLSPSSTHYKENHPAVKVAAASQVVAADFTTDLLMRVSIVTGWQQGDILRLPAGGNLLVTIGGRVLYRGVEIGTLIPQNQGLIVRFNTNATRESLEEVIRAITFQHTTDGPSASPRSIEFRMGGSGRHTVQVTVEPVNDLPVAGSVLLASIQEDSLSVTGKEVGRISGLFSDADSVDTMRGVVVVENPLDSSEGTWFYSTDRGVTWNILGFVNDQESSLVLASTAQLGFRPAPNFQGQPKPLRARVLDSTYTGRFSDARANVRQNLLPGFTNSVSANIGEISILVENINDPPTSTVSELSFVVNQDQSIDEVFPESYFQDIDSELTWSLSGILGLEPPSWLSFDPLTRRLTGTPRNRDVGTYELSLRARDHEYVVSILMNIRVENVNDRPDQLRFASTPLPEGIAGVRIGTLFANDPDGDAIVWSSNNSKIAIVEDQVFLVSAMDYETEQHLQVTFTATDLGADLLSSTLEVSLNVLDTNESYPELNSGILLLPDRTPSGTLLKTLQAPDQDIWQTVRYRIVSGDSHAFSLDEETGELRTQFVADINGDTSYKIFVEAYDNGSPSFSTTTEFSTEVKPVNNFAPEIAPDQRLRFAENAPSNVDIGTIIAMDPDQYPVKFELLEVIGGAVNWLQIDSLTGVVKTTPFSNFDFEQSPPFAVRVRATELFDPFRHIEATIPIELLNANDPPASLMPVRILTNRMGQVSTPISVLDQDLSSAGYGFTTNDPRFEIRDGALALRPEFHFGTSQAGTTTSALVTVIDNADSTSSSLLELTIQIIAGAPWQNPVNPLDVNRDGRVAASDALAIIGELNKRVKRHLDIPRRADQQSVPDFDVNGDNRISSADALLVISRLNSRGSAEGENRIANNPQSWLAAYEILELEAIRRRRR